MPRPVVWRLSARLARVYSAFSLGLGLVRSLYLAVAVHRLRTHANLSPSQPFFLHNCGFDMHVTRLPRCLLACVHVSRFACLLHTTAVQAKGCVQGPHWLHAYMLGTWKSNMAAGTILCPVKFFSLVALKSCT